MITSSVSLRWKFVERNRVPRTGISPRPGNLLMSVLVPFWISPAIAKLSPLPSSIEVCARRTVSAGIVMLLSVIAPCVES
jgi:hypothetical protein